MAGLLTLSTHALTDRMMVHTDFLPVVTGTLPVTIWATSVANARFRGMWESVAARVEPFPELHSFPEFPHNYLRRLNDLAWDYYRLDPSRLSMMRHVRDQDWTLPIRLLKLPARAVAGAGLHGWLEARVEKLLLGYERSVEATSRLAVLRPDVIVSTGTFRYEEPAVAAAAKRLGIPVLALITSWDNISIKNRMVFQYDGYLVWSPQMKAELLAAYPQSRNVPVYITGAPQFDVFFQTRRYEPRESFCARLGLDPSRPIVLHAMGVANKIDEHHGALDLARRVVGGQLGDAQLIVRPHPFQNELELRELFAEFGPQVVLQQNAADEARRIRSQDDEGINDWVNTFRHSDVVVHLSSTVAIDAALFDRPSVCMDYDPMPGQPRQELVREVNHLWTHYKPVAESGGTWLVNSPDELVGAVRSYLADPSLHRDQRRRMAEYVCGYIDGRCGRRLGEAVIDFAGRSAGARPALREACA